MGVLSTRNDNGDGSDFPQVNDASNDFDMKSFLGCLASVDAAQKQRDLQSVAWVPGSDVWSAYRFAQRYTSAVRPHE